MNFATPRVNSIDHLTGQKVLVNPSWVTAVTTREEAVIALPEVSPAVADIVKEVGDKPIIAESSAIRIDSELVHEDERLKIEGVNLIYAIPPAPVAGWGL